MVVAEVSTLTAEAGRRQSNLANEADLEIVV
jgi:hypothetical protein